MKLPLPFYAPPDPPAATPATPPATPPATTPPVDPPTPPATPPVEPPKAPASALSSPPGAPPAVTGDWPDDWREKIAAARPGPDGKADPKLVERLKRYDSPVTFGKAGLEAQDRIQSGKIAPDAVPMPDAKTDPEGNKKWREERGVPVDVAGYTLPDDVTKALLPEDKPVLASYIEFAHANGAPPSAVHLGAKWYLGMIEQQAAVQSAADTKASQATEDAMRKAWGDEYRANKGGAQRYATEAIPGVNMFEARLPNDPAFGENAGRKIGDIPQVAMAFAKFARYEFGDMDFVGGEQAKVTTSRIAELKTIMDTNIDRWNAEPGLRKEYYGLLEKAEKVPARA